MIIQDVKTIECLMRDKGKTRSTVIHQVDATDVNDLVVDDLSSDLAGPFNFTVATGSCLTITGASGSGKSLLLRLIADLDPGTGDVRLGDLDRSLVGGPDWRRQCPYVAASPGFWRSTAADHFDLSNRKRALELARSMLFDASRFDAPIDQLSTGERQRVALLRALVLDPPILLLDEPTGPLDTAATQAVASILAERMKQGMTLVLVTHDVGLAERLASERREMLDRKLLPV